MWGFAMKFKALAAFGGFARFSTEFRVVGLQAQSFDCRALVFRVRGGVGDLYGGLENRGGIFGGVQIMIMLFSLLSVTNSGVAPEVGPWSRACALAGDSTAYTRC